MIINQFMYMSFHDSFNRILNSSIHFLVKKVTIVQIVLHYWKFLDWVYPTFLLQSKLQTNVPTPLPGLTHVVVEPAQTTLGQLRREAFALMNMEQIVVGNSP